jgi:hypothetical protein
VSEIKPNGHKIDQMGVNVIYQHLPLQDPPKLTQIGIFGLKICHLATLNRISKISNNVLAAEKN